MTFKSKLDPIPSPESPAEPDLEPKPDPEKPDPEIGSKPSPDFAPELDPIPSPS